MIAVGFASKDILGGVMQTTLDWSNHAEEYDFLRGEGFLSGQEREPQWQLLDPFVRVGDFIGLSTYPFFDYEIPEAAPADYYAEVAKRTGLPLAFTEMVWPSRPLSNFPEAGYGGPEAEAVFAECFLALLGGVEVRFALWSFLHDLGAPGGPAFEAVALRENDGTPKPVLDVWRAASE